MKRSLVQTGSSLAITLPIDIVHAFGLKKGQEVELSVHPQSGAVVIRLGVPRLDGGQVTERFRGLADAVLERRATLLRRLARSAR
jgi:bifunctional DNA-binding transcriptional regulator/antitoxin component of YhaV-PrlF toxin-antitoxin module